MFSSKKIEMLLPTVKWLLPTVMLLPMVYGKKSCCDEQLYNSLCPYVCIYVCRSVFQSPKVGMKRGTPGKIFQESCRIELLFHWCYPQALKPPGSAPKRGIKFGVNLTQDSKILSVLFNLSIH